MLWNTNEHIISSWRCINGVITIMFILVLSVGDIATFLPYFMQKLTSRAGARCSDWSCLLGKSDIASSNHALAFKLQRNSLVQTQYCGKPPWPRGSVLGLRPPGLECRIMCLKCHRIHLTILRRFSRSSLAYMSTKVAPIHCIAFHLFHAKFSDNFCIGFACNYHSLKQSKLPLQNHTCSLSVITNNKL